MDATGAIASHAVGLNWEAIDGPARLAAATSFMTASALASLALKHRMPRIYGQRCRAGLAKAGIALCWVVWNAWRQQMRRS